MAETPLSTAWPEGEPVGSLTERAQGAPARQVPKQCVPQTVLCTGLPSRGRGAQQVRGNRTTAVVDGNWCGCPGCINLPLRQSRGLGAKHCCWLSLQPEPDPDLGVRSKSRGGAAPCTGSSNARGPSSHGKPHTRCPMSTHGRDLDPLEQRGQCSTSCAVDSKVDVVRGILAPFLGASGIQQVGLA